MRLSVSFVTGIWVRHLVSSHLHDYQTLTVRDPLQYEGYPFACCGAVLTMNLAEYLVFYPVVGPGKDHEV